MTRRLTLLLLLLSLPGCRYRLGDGGTLASSYRTLSIAYVQGDCTGLLTEALVRQLGASGAFVYCYVGGDLTLRACVVDCGTENIGFRRDENREGENIERLLPDEARLYYVVEFWVVENHTGRRVLGPSRVCEAVTYDFDPLSTERDLFTISLGQYSNRDEAEHAAHAPLFDRIARKVIDYVVAAW